MKKSDYYKGGYRITIQGVPCRVTIKPTEHMLALLRMSGPASQGYPVDANDYNQLRKCKQLAEELDWTLPGLEYRASEQDAA